MDPALIAIIAVLISMGLHIATISVAWGRMRQQLADRDQRFDAMAQDMRELENRMNDRMERIEARFDRLVEAIMYDRIGALPVTRKSEPVPDPMGLREDDPLIALTVQLSPITANPGLIMQNALDMHGNELIERYANARNVSFLDYLVLVAICVRAARRNGVEKTISRMMESPA